jgi:hypothetical protein
VRKIPLIGVIVVVALITVYWTTRPYTDNGAVQIDCSTFSAVEAGLDSLGQGSGHENARIEVFDGAGTVIFTRTFVSSPGNDRKGLIRTELYDTAPKFNPITVMGTRLASHGLSEVATVIGTGSCAGLMTVSACLALSANAIGGNMPFAILGIGQGLAICHA